MENHQEDGIILPESQNAPEIAKALADQTDRSQSSHKLSKFLILAIVASVGFLVTLFLLVFNGNSATRCDSSSQSSNSFKYDSAELKTALDQVEDRLSLGDLSCAEDQIGKFSIPERMTAAQRYRFYNLYIKLYGENGRNNPSRVESFTRLAQESLNAILRAQD